MCTVFLHADNHKHDGMKIVFQNLLQAALGGRIMLLCEGTVYKEGGYRQVHSHGINWEGDHPNINGLENCGNVINIAWAKATQLALHSGFPCTQKICSMGREGANLMRSVCILCALLPDQADDMIYARSMLDFVQTLRTKVCTLNITSYWSGQLHEHAHSVMRMNDSKWPCGDCTLKEIADLCLQLKKYFTVTEDVVSAINHILVVDRETTWAKVIQQCQVSTTLPIHIILGAGHCVPTISSACSRNLCLDEKKIREQQVQIQEPRLVELIQCNVVDDPFQSV